MRLEGKTAIVTGGASGFGEGIVRRFVAEGARVAIADINAQSAAALAGELGVACIAVATDVADADSVAALFDRVSTAFGGLDILVNNAANPLATPLTDMTSAAFDASYGVNVKGPVLLAARALEHLAASSHGVVINMITVGAFNPGEYLGLYCSGKAALWSLTRVMAKEWAPRGVRVNAIAPGPFRTDMMAATYEIPEFYDRIVDSTLLKRVAEPEEILGAALFLASDASAFVTGSCVTVDGGIMA
jgi:NAD(P)-dependent dehydrogenase (short-subunit alcohol dehydrogenase family)